jgi:hypothetical protein
LRGVLDIDPDTWLSSSTLTPLTLALTTTTHRTTTNTTVTLHYENFEQLQDDLRPTDRPSDRDEEVQIERPLLLINGAWLDNRWFRIRHLTWHDREDDTHHFEYILIRVFRYIDNVHIYISKKIGITLHRTTLSNTEVREEFSQIIEEGNLPVPDELELYNNPRPVVHLIERNLRP